MKLRLIGSARRRFEIDVRSADFDEYWTSNTEFKGPVGRYVGALTPEDREAFKEELRKRLPEATDGSIQYTARVHAVQGVVRA